MSRRPAPDRYVDGVPFFDNAGVRIHFSERGDTDGQPLVLIHGLLLSSRMMRRLASYLPEQRVLLIDVRGHGASDKPTDAAAYSWSSLASDVIGLLDHLGLERAVVGGLSLGANVTLATGNEAPERVAGMIVEMPVLDGSEWAARPVFGALATMLDVGAPVLGPFGRAVSHLPLPGHVPELALVRDVLSLRPKSGAALVHGLLADELLLDDLDVPRLTMPTLVIGHGGDPLHALDDARALAALLPDAQLDVRHTIADYRVKPQQLARLLGDFLARC